MLVFWEVFFLWIDYVFQNECPHFKYYLYSVFLTEHEIILVEIFGCSLY